MQGQGQTHWSSGAARAPVLRASFASSARIELNRQTELYRRIELCRRVDQYKFFLRHL